MRGHNTSQGVKEGPGEIFSEDSLPASEPVGLVDGTQVLSLGTECLKL